MDKEALTTNRSRKARSLLSSRLQRRFLRKMIKGPTPRKTFDLSVVFNYIALTAGEGRLSSLFHEVE